MLLALVVPISGFASELPLGFWITGSSIESLNGVFGPRLAQSILSGMEPQRLLRLLRDADAKGLKKAPGVGPKLAERIAVELRDEAEKLARRLGGDAATGQPTVFDDAAPDEELLSALVNLGYPRNQAERLVESALAEAAPGASLEDLIRVALRALA